MKNNAIQYNLVVLTLFFAAFSACQQPETPTKPPRGPGTSATPTLASLEIYDSTDKTTPLLLGKSNINSDTNTVVAAETAEAIFIELSTLYPTETTVDISVGLTHNYPPGREGDGIPLPGNITITIDVLVKETGDKKKYAIGVVKGFINDIERDLINDPIGTHTVYWSGTSIPLNTPEYTVREEAGYDTIEAAWNAIIEGGAGTAENPDIIMLGRDLEMKTVSTLSMEGRHIKIIVPPFRKYTISRSKEGGAFYTGSFFEIKAPDSSLTLSAYDLTNTNNKVDSMLVLEGGAVWSASSINDPTAGSNTGAIGGGALISVSSGGVLNMDKWVVLQNHNVEVADNGAIVVQGGTFNMRGGKILKNRAHSGALVLKADGKARIFGGSFEYNSTSTSAPPGGGAIRMLAVNPPPDLVISGGAFIGNQVHMGTTANTLGGGAIYAQGGTLTIANPQTLAILKELDDAPTSYDEDPLDPLPGHWMSEIENIDFVEKEPLIEYKALSTLNTNTLPEYIGKISAANLILFKGNLSKATEMGSGGGAIMLMSSNAAVSTKARIFDVLFEDNTAVANGGAMSAKNKEGYVIKNSIFRNNASVPIVPTETNTGGGAIRNNIAARTELIRLDNVIFTKNKAFKGGAIAHTTLTTETETGTKKLVITDSIFQENEATSTTVSTGYGGAILFYDAYDEIEIFASQFEKNSAKTGGGAIALMGIGTTHINGELGNLTKIIENTSGGVNATGGGGLFVSRNGKVTVDYTEIRGNTAEGATGGGGILYTGEDIAEFGGDVVIAGNTAPGDETNDAYGGGIFNMSQNGAIHLLDGATVGGSTPEDANFAHKGGGIAIKGTNTADAALFASLLLKSDAEKPKSQILGNGTVTEDGAEKMTYLGGGIYAEGHILFEIGGAVSNNKAFAGGGGIFVEHNSTGRTATPANFSKVELSAGAKIKNNVVKEHVVNNVYSNAGGGIHIRRNGDPTNSYLLLLMDDNDIEISGNKAAKGAGIYLHNLAFFGSVPNYDAGFVMNGGLIKNNEALCPTVGVMILGGGICLTGSVPSESLQQSTGFYMSDGSIEGNKAIGTQAAGGGVFLNNNSKFTFAGGTIKNNDAGLCGGGVSVGGFALTTATAGIKFLINGGTLEGNTAGNYGGAVFMEASVDGAVEFREGFFANNKYTNITGQRDGHTVFVSSGRMNITAQSLSLIPSMVIQTPPYEVIDGDNDAYVYQ